MKKKYHYLLIFSLLPCVALFGFQKDSLLLIWEDSGQADSVRFQAFYDLIFSKYIFNAPDTALLLAGEMLDQASRKEDLFWEGKALHLLGTTYSIKSAYDQALLHLQLSLEKYQLGQYRAPQVGVYNNIGLCYHFSGDYLQAISSFQKGLAIAEEVQLEGRTKLTNLGNLSKVYEDIGDYELAKFYLQQVLTLADDPAITAGAYHSLGSIHLKQADYANAEKYLALSIEKGKIIQNHAILAFAYLDLGKLRLTTGALPLAEAALREAAQLFQKIGNKQYLASTYAQLGILFYQLHQYRQGLDWCNKANTLAEHSDFLAERKEVCQCAYLNQRALHDYEGALRNHVLLAELQDSLLDKEKIRMAAKMEMQYTFDLEKSHTDAAQKEALLQVELKQSKTVLQYSRIVAVLFMTILIGSIVFFSFYRKRSNDHSRQLQEKNSVLTAKNQELERFAFITSHDLKEPVRNISIFSDLLRKKIDQPEREEYLDFIKAAALKLYALIESIMTFTKVNNKPESLETVDLEEVIAVVQDNLHHRIMDSNARLSQRSLPLVVGVRSQLIILFQNIIENAIKYHREDPPLIEIEWQEDQQEYTFTIKDNGLGIDRDFLQKIFDPFSRLNGGVQGSGLGLSIANSIVQHHQGRIWVVSEIGVGSTFYFTLAKRPEVSQRK